MKPSNLEFILVEALAHGNHNPECAFEKARPLANLPARHPRHVDMPNVNVCDCWMRKAGRMLRAMDSVGRTDLSGD